MGVRKSDVSILRLVIGRGFFSASSSLYTTQPILFEIFLFFICPSSNSVARKLFLGRKKNIGGTFFPLASPKRYAYAGIVIHVHTG